MVELNPSELLSIGVVGLGAFVFNSINNRIKKLEDTTITRDRCGQCDKNKEDKIGDLKEMFDKRSIGVMGVVEESNNLMRQIRDNMKGNK